MTFNGVDFKSLGIVVQFVNGILDMPNRKGETFYDWGDEIEPLVSAEDIYFGVRHIVFDAFFDERLGVDFGMASDTLRDVTDNADLVTDYGTYSVRLDELRIIRSYKGGKTLKIIFKELNPDLSGGLPTSTGLDGVRIDGYDLFTNFGLLVEEVKKFEVSKLKPSRETTYKSNPLMRYRQPPEIEVKVNANYASKADMTTKIKALNALLAKPGLRHFVHKGTGFQCMIDEGFKVNFKRLLVSINLKLKVMAEYNIEAIVQEVLNRVELEARPQSDLLQTDNTQADFIKGKDTWKAADSDKLDGQDSTHYAKESEMAGARDLDLSNRIETNTSF